jgi:hypothetical protein
LSNRPDNYPLVEQILWLFISKAATGWYGGAKLAKFIKLINKTLDIITVRVYISTFCCTMNS